MELLSQKVDVWGQVPLDLESTLKWIERAGRGCYDSLNKIKPGSAEKFVANVLKPVPPHASVLEHSNLVLRSNKLRHPKARQGTIKGKINSNFIFTGIQHDHVFIYGNWRAFFEEHKEIDFFDLPNAIEAHYPGFEVITNPEEVPYFAQAATIEFLTSRAQTHEIVRHRHKTAFSQRSQRYCSESNLKIIKPVWYDVASLSVKRDFMIFCYQAEDAYRFLRKNGHKAQEARVVLPNCMATLIVVSAYLSEWDWIFYLRRSPAADPPIRNLMNNAKTKMIEMRIIDSE